MNAIRTVVTVAALISTNASATPFNPLLDEFWITKNLTATGAPNEIFRDSFNNGIVPPSGPDGEPTYFVEGPAGMAGESVGSESEGKLTLDPILGIPQLNPEGNINIRVAGRRLLSTNPMNAQTLGPADAFTVNTIFDLSSLPEVPASGFGVRVEDRGTGIPTNDIVLLEVARSRVSGTLLVLFQELDFSTSSAEILDAIPLQIILDANPMAAQIQLSITKAASTDLVGGFFTIFDGVGAVLASQSLDNLGNVSGLPARIFEGEGFTRGAFQARTQIAVQEPGAIALLAVGLLGVGIARRRRAV